MKLRKIQIIIDTSKEYKFGSIPDSFIFAGKATTDITIPKDIKNPENLYIKFNLVNNISNASLASKSYIDIYNLKEYSYILINNNVENKIKIILGYDDNLFIAFDGQISDIKTHKDKQHNRITRITLLKNTLHLTKQIIMQSFQHEVSLNHLIVDIGKKVGLKVKLDKQANDVMLPHYSFVGNTPHALDSLTKMLGFNWFMQDNTIHVKSKKQVQKLKDDFTIELNESSGIIGKPTLTAKGIDIKMLVHPLIVVGSNIVLKNKFLSDGYNGNYHVFEVVHKGDNQAGGFFTKIKCLKQGVSDK